MKLKYVALCLLFLLCCAVSARAADEPIIEASAGSGVTVFEQMAISRSAASVLGKYIPYGSLHLRLGDGKFLCPEIIAEDSGAFKFNSYGIKEGSGASSYNNYLIKLPLGVSVPFFYYDASLFLDARYSSATTGLRLKENILINNESYKSGDEFSAVSSEMMFRLYLNTPVVSEQNFFEYSYFGAFYSERVVPRTASPPKSTPEEMPDILLSTVTKTGGFFYDIKKRTLLNGLSFEASANLGYGNMFKQGETAGISLGNARDLLVFYARSAASYKHMFSDSLGADINFGVSFFVTTEFLRTADDSAYTVNNGGDFRYFATINFIFGD